MELEFSTYRLQLRAAANSRTALKFVEGILVRRNGGYGCLQTWPSLGERRWQEEWSAICTGDWSSPAASQLDRCLNLDSTARAENRNLFENMEIPSSYFSISARHTVADIEEADRLGFKGGKLKSFLPLSKLTERLSLLHQRFPDWSWRVDFNGSIEPDEFRDWAENLSDEVRTALLYVEDPCPSLRSWPVIDDLQFAEDRCLDESTGKAHIQVVKPAICDWRSRRDGGAMVLTSNFQHPLGVLFDWFEAARVLEAGCQLLDCGLVTQQIFANNPWSDALGSPRPQPEPPDEPGLGLGDLLEKLDWQSA